MKRSQKIAVIGASLALGIAAFAQAHPGEGNQAQHNRHQGMQHGAQGAQGMQQRHQAMAGRMAQMQQRHQHGGNDAQHQHGGNDAQHQHGRRGQAGSQQPAPSTQ